ncbi:FAD-dependent oxidoreductase, partial [bacterium]
HPWIEAFGCTARYRRYRDTVRRLSPGEKPEDPRKHNPGGGWVSNLCHLPEVGWHALMEMLLPVLRSGHVDLRLRTVAQGVNLLSSTVARETGSARPLVEGDRVVAVPLLDLQSGVETLVYAKYVLDATELGDLLPLTGTEYVQGAESGDETGEPHAPSSPARPDNQQGWTWVMAVAHDPEEDRTIEKPAQYERWASYAPEGWRGRLFQYGDLTPATNEPRDLPLFSEDWRCWFKYRQIVRSSDFPHGGVHDTTIVNWPQNDYFVAPLTDCTPEQAAQRLEDSRQMSLSWLYWMQTEGGARGLYLRPDLTGTEDGLAKTPYIRESRRIRALHMIREQDVVPTGNEDRMAHREDSVGVGAYRIDLHFSTGGDRYIDASSLPFQIPLGALVPQRMRNLLPACKNIGTTHITNGCYRLHPVEWNIGEAAGLLAAFCIQRDTEPQAVHGSAELFQEYWGLLRSQGVETEWPRLRAL